MPVDRVPVHSIKRKNSVDVTASKVVIIREDFFHSGSMAAEEGEASNFGFKFLIFCKIRFVDGHSFAAIGRLC